MTYALLKRTKSLTITYLLTIWNHSYFAGPAVSVSEETFLMPFTNKTQLFKKIYQSRKLLRRLCNIRVAHISYPSQRYKIDIRF